MLLISNGFHFTLKSEMLPRAFTEKDNDFTYKRNMKRLLQWKLQASLNHIVNKGKYAMTFRDKVSSNSLFFFFFIPNISWSRYVGRQTSSMNVCNQGHEVLFMYLYPSNKLNLGLQFGKVYSKKISAASVISQTLRKAHLSFLKSWARIFLLVTIGFCIFPFRVPVHMDKHFLFLIPLLWQ